MAKITKHEVNPVPPPPTFTLELDEEELKVVYALVGRAVGSGNYLRACRRVFRAIYVALDVNSTAVGVSITGGVNISG